MPPTLMDGNSSNSLVSKTENLTITEVSSGSRGSTEQISLKHLNEVTVKRIAKKSTTPVDLRQPPAAATRRQVALANSNKKNYGSHDKFLENFDPESSARERRKLTRKVIVSAPAPAPRKVPGAVYDENGIHIITGIDLCDCLQKMCPGCHYPCPKCRSTKCGPECRCNRKYAFEQIEYHGCDLVIKNPLHK